MSDDSLSIEFSLVPDEPVQGITNIRLVCEADESTVLMFRGAIVEDDGMTSWERRIAELEAEVERLRAENEEWRSLWHKSGCKPRSEVERELGVAESDAANKKPSPEACE